MKRDIEKIIAETEIPNQYDLRASEIYALIDGSQDQYDMMIRAWKLGFSLGTRNGKRAAVRRKKAAKVKTTAGEIKALAKALETTPGEILGEKESGAR